MKHPNIIQIFLTLITIMVFSSFNCTRHKPDEIKSISRKPVIEPDYSDVVIPRNIAPMNFIISEEGEEYSVVVKSSNGFELRQNYKNENIRFPLKLWKKLLAGSGEGKLEFEILSRFKGGRANKYKSFSMNIAKEPVDPYLCYRLLYPGYETWGEMKIIQRSVEDFKEYSVVENQVLDGNCMNCHSFIQNKPDRFLIHVRGSNAGTYFVDNKTITRRELRTKEMPGNAVYPAWHPLGKYVVFSSNMIFSVIHMRPERNMELFDRYSILVLYNIENNEMSVCGENYKGDYMETYPFWSPDGNYLYYCRALQIKPGFDFKQIKYNIFRMHFDKDSGKFEDPEIIFDAQGINKSASLPTISPLGNYLVFTLHDYGNFAGWHKEADLYALHLQNRVLNRLSLNSGETESFTSWSSNGFWLVFSSKRGDGFTSRPYIAYFKNADSIGKPFILPQKDPGLYKMSEKSLNRPEFVTGKIKPGPRDFANASKVESIKAIWSNKKE